MDARVKPAGDEQTFAPRMTLNLVTRHLAFDQQVKIFLILDRLRRVVEKTFAENVVATPVLQGEFVKPSRLA
jgi:hypothetical protein